MRFFVFSPKWYTVKAEKGWESQKLRPNKINLKYAILTRYEKIADRKKINVEQITVKKIKLLNKNLDIH